jgi:Kinesin motor domain
MTVESTANVRVAIRVRPLSSAERLENSTPETVSLVLDDGSGISQEPSFSSACQLIIGKKHTFSFDKVYGTEVNQTTLFETSVLPLLDKYLEGYNVTIFAYGQVSSPIV